MADHHADMLRVLIQFGMFGSLPQFQAVTKALAEHATSSEPAKIPVVTALKVANRLIDIIEHNEDKDNSVRAWDTLTILGSRIFNSNALDFLTELQSTQILSFVQRTITTFLSDDTGIEVQACLKFLTLFTREDETRKILVGQTPGFMETYVALVEAKFKTSQNSLKIDLMNVLRNVVGRSEFTSRVNIDSFVACDGFRIMNALLVDVSTWAHDILEQRSLDTEETSVLNALLSCLCNVYCSLSCVGMRHASEVPKEKYILEADNLVTIIQIAYYLFPLSDEVRFKSSALAVFVNFCEYLVSVLPGALPPALMFSGDHGENVPFIVQYMRASSDPRLSHAHARMAKVVERYASVHPSVRAAVDQEALLSAEVCAFPGCFLNPVNGGAMKK